ncbi:MAG TPA: 4Fe-4S dicluster domain-containing protein [Clostridiaceae bacterium]|nr:4Fe-4S dicluster domain-containing protein [Clostridiaceae bacterium]
MLKEKEKKRLFIDASLCLGCKTCELRCAVERGSVSKNLYEAVNEEALPRPRVYVQWDGEISFPLQCRHCEDAKCLEICSSGAIKRDEETGCVYQDTEKCICCWMCIMVCPYGVISPAIEKNCADKCDQCFQMERPYCLSACPTGAIKLLTPGQINELLTERRKKVSHDQLNTK